MATDYGNRGLARAVVRKVLAALPAKRKMKRFVFLTEVLTTLPVGYYDRRRTRTKRQWGEEAFVNMSLANLIDSMENDGQVERFGNDGTDDCTWKIRLTPLGRALYREDKARNLIEEARAELVLACAATAELRRRCNLPAPVEEVTAVLPKQGEPKLSLELLAQAVKEHPAVSYRAQALKLGVSRQYFCRRIKQYLSTGK